MTSSSPTVVVRIDGKPIGRLDPETFREVYDLPVHLSVEDLSPYFNARQEAADAPQRASLEENRRVVR